MPTFLCTLHLLSPASTRWKPRAIFPSEFGRLSGNTFTYRIVRYPRAELHKRFTATQLKLYVDEALRQAVQVCSIVNSEVIVIGIPGVVIGDERPIRRVQAVHRGGH